MEKQCPDCKGQLEKGCLMDQTYGAVTVQRYAPDSACYSLQDLPQGAISPGQSPIGSS